MTRAGRSGTEDPGVPGEDRLRARLEEFRSGRFRWAVGDFDFLALRECDVQAIRRWRNAQIRFLRQKHPLSEEDQAAWWRDVVVPTHGSRRPVFLLVSILREGRCIGYGGLVNIDWDHRRAEVSFLLDDSLGAEPAGHAAAFSRFLEFVKELAFRDLGLHRLYTETYAFREEHIGVLEAAGFLREGRLVHHTWRGGEPVDSLLHGLCAGDRDRPAPGPAPTEPASPGDAGGRGRGA